MNCGRFREGSPTPFLSSPSSRSSVAELHVHANGTLKTIMHKKTAKNLLVIVPLIKQIIANRVKTQW